MKKNVQSWLVGALVLMVGGLASGCYAHNQIPATELPKLNNMSTQSTTSGDLTVVTRTVQNVTRTDGTIVQIQGEFAATIVPRNGQPRVRFSHPVQSSVDSFNLTVAGGNRVATLFSLEHIDFIEISTHDVGLSVLAALGMTLLVAGGGAAVGIALAY